MPSIEHPPQAAARSDDATPIAMDAANGAVMSRFVSSHIGSMPSLFADGAVRPIAYTIDNASWQNLWTYNDGNVLTTLDGM